MCKALSAKSKTNPNSKNPPRNLWISSLVVIKCKPKKVAVARASNSNKSMKVITSIKNS